MSWAFYITKQQEGGPKHPPKSHIANVLGGYRLDECSGGRLSTKRIDSRKSPSDSRCESPGHLRDGRSTFSGRRLFEFMPIVGGGFHSLRICPYPMVWPLPRPWSETMVSIPPLSTENPRNKGFSGSGAPIFGFGLADPRAKGVGVDPFFADDWGSKKIPSPLLTVREVPLGSHYYMT